MLDRVRLETQLFRLRNSWNILPCCAVEFLIWELYKQKSAAKIDHERLIWQNLGLFVEQVYRPDQFTILEPQHPSIDSCKLHIDLVWFWCSKIVKRSVGTEFKESDTRSERTIIPSMPAHSLDTQRKKSAPKIASYIFQWARRNIPPFFSLKIRRSTFHNYIKFANLRILRLKSCEMFGQEVDKNFFLSYSTPLVECWRSVNSPVIFSPTR